jgi:hypothetical protein
MRHTEEPKVTVAIFEERSKHVDLRVNAIEVNLMKRLDTLEDKMDIALAHMNRSKGWEAAMIFMAGVAGIIGGLIAKVIK